MAPHFLLTFGTITGNSRTLRINNPNLGVTDATVRSAMDTMIGSMAVANAAGRINSRRRASLIETEIIPIDLN